MAGVRKKEELTVCRKCGVKFDMEIEWCFAEYDKLEEKGGGPEVGGELTVDIPEVRRENAHLCLKCIESEKSMLCRYHAHHEGWMEVAKMAELELWDRQPRETDLEWKVWLGYRGMYPREKPTFRGVAEMPGVATTVANVRAIALRWDYAVRMQAWARHTDLETMKKNEQEIVAMNEQQISVAAKLSRKIEAAVDNLDPLTISSKELSTLMKTSADIERKAREDYKKSIKTIMDLRNEQVGKELGIKSDEKVVKKEELQEVVKILASAGVLGDVVGIKRTTTTTTEIVGNEALEVSGHEVEKSEESDEGLDEGND